MAPIARLSGLQKDVLALYRSILRESIRKDRKVASSLLSSSSTSSSSSTNTTTLDYARKKFRQEAAQVPRSDFKTIEYKIRKGRKQLELLKMPGVNVVGGA
ncbi:hypothetical protein ACHAXH_002562 [Discostella pseudostelligera]